jgi:hypothetical protein
MAYTTPTAAQLKARHPAFAAVPDLTVEAFITDANRDVDTTWLEADYARAIMLLACHLMVREGIIGSSVVDGAVVQSEKLGDASTTYAVPQQSGSSETNDFQSTTYGQQFARVRRQNVGGPLVSSIPTVLQA